MKVLVTGGSGKVGRYVVESLLPDHSVSVLDTRNPTGAYNAYHRVDVLSLSALNRAMEGYDAVVHLAGIPHPLDHPGDRVFQVNTIGTFNVLEACAAAGVGTMIFMSSESTLGFAFAKNRMSPVYVPIDEEHPLRPQDPYGMSKVSGEMLCAGYSRTYGMRTVALRAPWIWVPEDEDRKLYRNLVRNYGDWSQNLWAYIDVLDVCSAVRAALVPDVTAGHEVFFIAADDQWTDQKTRDLVRKYYPDLIVPEGMYPGRESLIGSSKARKVLGFQPHYTCADILH